MQISHKNATRHGWDQTRLLEDELYNLRAACMILTYNQKHYAHKVKYWIGIYRSGIALSQERTRNNAIAYDRIVRNTAERLGYKPRHITRVIAQTSKKHVR